MVRSLGEVTRLPPLHEYATIVEERERSMRIASEKQRWRKIFCEKEMKTKEKVKERGREREREREREKGDSINTGLTSHRKILPTLTRSG